VTSSSVHTRLALPLRRSGGPSVCGSSRWFTDTGRRSVRGASVTLTTPNAAVRSSPAVASMIGRSVLQPSPALSLTTPSHFVTTTTTSTNVTAVSPKNVDMDMRLTAKLVHARG